MALIHVRSVKGCAFLQASDADSQNAEARLGARRFDGGPHWPVGSQSTRPHLSGARLDCAGQTRQARAALSTCRVLPGSSGGPALVEKEDGWAVWGVISAVNAEGTLVALVGVKIRSARFKE